MAPQEEIRPFVLVLNEAFVERLGDDGVRRYVDALAEIVEHRRAEGEDEIAEAIHRAFSQPPLEMPRVERQRLAERLAAPGWTHLHIRTEFGQVLYGPDLDLDALVDHAVNLADPATDKGVF